MLLPPAVQDFLDMSSDPDFDDLDGYQADTSINTNNSTRSSTPIMMLSDDLLSNPACWPTYHANRIHAHLVSTPTPLKDDSITEPESEPEEPPIKTPPPTLLPLQDDPSSVTELESDDEELLIKLKLLIKLLPLKEDLSSVTEPESDVKELPITGATITPKKRGFFDTPSPPGLDSLYWKQQLSCSMFN
ncbi:hypothetical protein EDB19DRAFT_1911603 [Suillus lakei]|nr:hypothetical protein EDB19DRAFT_1911603 [Suillus lakei]